MGSTYTVEQLLALRRGNSTYPHPEIVSGLNIRESNLLGSYLSIFRKYQRTIRDGPEPFRLKFKPDYVEVWRYDFALSNKEFKRRWVKTHNTSAGLKDQRRVLVKVLSPRVRFLEEYFRAVSRLEKSLSRLLNRMAPTTRPHQEVVKPSPSRSEIPAKVGKSKNPPFKRDRRAVHLQVVPHAQHTETYFRVIGGLTYTYDPYKPPPDPRWKKYWYYFRKRGKWHPSEHHPYGDEPIHLIYDGREVQQ